LWQDKEKGRQGDKEKSGGEAAEAFSLSPLLHVSLSYDDSL
jgi:hypothetical protein